MTAQPGGMSYPSGGSFTVLGMRVDTLDPGNVLDRVMGLVETGRPAYVCVANVHQCMLVHDDPEFARVSNGAAMVITDSRVLHRAVDRKYGLASLPTIRGAELMTELCARAEAQNVPVALVGGRDDELLETLATRLLQRYPRLRIVYRFSPPFRTPTSEEEGAMIQDIRQSGAKLVFVGLGCPKQERWMARHSPKLDATLIGVGAAFDFNSGAVKKSPAWIHAAGLEWLYRLIAEPRRLGRRYLTSSPRFLLAYYRTERSAAARR